VVQGMEGRVIWAWALLSTRKDGDSILSIGNGRKMAGRNGDFVVMEWACLGLYLECLA
jgi:hypothetical protein